MQHGPQMHMGSAAKKLASYEVAFKGKKQIAESTFAFTFEKPKGFNFKSGQHIRMTLINPSETDAEGDKRFLTMASTPSEPDLVFAMRMRDTAFKRVLARLRIGDKVLLQKLMGESPHGSFALHKDASKPAVFIAGGIGIVPAYSMIKDACARKLPHKLFLFYSNRRPEDAPYLADLEKLAMQNPNFKLIATMTEPEKSAKKWQGETERIGQALINKYLQDLQHPIYYVSGLPEMVSAMKVLLNSLGVPKDNVQAEEFTGFNLNDIDGKTNRTGKDHLLLLAIAVAIIGLMIVHITGFKSIFHSGLGALSFTNPISYLVIGFILAVILIKFKLFSMGFRHSLNRKRHSNTAKNNNKSL